MVIFLLMLAKSITEFLSLTYMSTYEKLVKKFVNEGVLDSAIFSIEAIEGRTLLILMFLLLCNFVCDLVVCITMDISMASYYAEGILSKGIRSEHVKSIEYREVAIGGGPFMVRRIPIMILNEKLVSKTIKLIYIDYSTVISLHIVFLFASLIVYFTYP